MLLDRIHDRQDSFCFCRNDRNSAEEMSSHPLGAAVDNILHGPPVTGRHGVTVPVDVLGTTGSENIRYPRHDRITDRQ